MTAIVIKSPKGLRELSNSSLVTMYNARVPKDRQVKKFRDKDTGVRRLWAVIKADRPTFARGRKDDRTRTIRVLADSNPKRAGSIAYDRFERYAGSPTVADMFDICGTTWGHINWDVSHGYIELV